MLISEFFLKRFFCFLILFTAFPFLVYSQAVPDRVTITARGPLQVSEVRVKLGDSVLSGDILAVMKRADGSKLTLRAGVSGRILPETPARRVSLLPSARFITARMSPESTESPSFTRTSETCRGPRAVMVTRSGTA